MQAQMRRKAPQKHPRAHFVLTHKPVRFFVQNIKNMHRTKEQVQLQLLNKKTTMRSFRLSFLYRHYRIHLKVYATMARAAGINGIHDNLIFILISVSSNNITVILAEFFTYIILSQLHAYVKNY